MKHCGTQELETGRLLLRRLTVDDSEMMFNVTPLKYISTIANISEIGMLRAMITVGLRSRRNKIRTIIPTAAGPRPPRC